jgi:hypothetical protein
MATGAQADGGVALGNRQPRLNNEQQRKKANSGSPFFFSPLPAD